MATTVGIIRIIAHQGGWDEILLVAAPILVIGGLLMVANRRAKQLNETNPTEADKTGTGRS